MASVVLTTDQIDNSWEGSSREIVQKGILVWKEETGSVIPTAKVSEKEISKIEALKHQPRDLLEAQSFIVVWISIFGNSLNQLHFWVSRCGLWEQVYTKDRNLWRQEGCSTGIFINILFYLIERHFSKEYRQASAFTVKELPMSLGLERPTGLNLMLQLLY